jgi:hypothetical protein
MLKLLNNFWFKLIAIVLGLLLWFHVATEKDYSYQVWLPVNDVALGDDLTLAQNPPDSLLVSVSASGKALLRRDWRTGGLRIIVTQYKTGRHNINLNTGNTSLTHGGSAIVLEEVLTPSNIILQIDHEAEVQVNVAPALTSVPAPGFTVRSISEPVPSRVTLHGPRSLLGRYNLVYTEERELTNLRSNVTITLPLETPQGYGLWLEPDSVRITLEIVPVKTRVFERIPVVVYNSPVDRIVKVDPPTIDVEVTGPPGEIDLLNPNAIAASVDFETRTPEGNIGVKVDIPARYQLRNIIPDSVTISLE